MEKKQKIQEYSYEIPYHWFMKPFNFNERIYFGYLTICIDFINSLKNRKILDAGCGDGRFLEELKNKGANNLFGVDYSERAVLFAKILIPEANIQTGNLFALPYEDNFFDTIFMIEVLEHIKLDKVDNVLRELRRVLNKNGNIIITVPSDKKTLEAKHYQHFSEKILREVLSSFFRVEDIIGQDKIGFSFLKFFYKFLDNRYWLLKYPSTWYNLNIWPRFFNKCNADQGNRLIAYCFKDEK